MPNLITRRIDEDACIALPIDDSGLEKRCNINENDHSTKYAVTESYSKIPFIESYCKQSRVGTNAKCNMYQSNINSQSFIIHIMKSRYHCIDMKSITRIAEESTER